MAHHRGGEGCRRVVTHYVGTHQDITERKLSEQRIAELAYYDQLTGLPNRTLLLDRLRQAITATARSDSHGALLFIDLDNFKSLNDPLGHDQGDLVLKLVAQRLTHYVRAGDTVARLGGDEFVAVLAMYKAKDAGRNSLRFFDPDMETAVMEWAALERDLRQAVREGQFQLHYQAQMLGAGRITGAEVLARWPHPQRGMVSPAEFISLAEETGLILPLGHWVLASACGQLAAWSARPETAHLTVAVNVSAHQFRHPEFVASVLGTLERSF